MSLSQQKFCPKCQSGKSVNEFYVCRARSDGRSAWCKVCSNAQRQKYKKVEKTIEYKLVARASKAKPTTCPDCGATNVPSNRMRGRVDDETGKIVFSCFDCRQAVIQSQKTGINWCDWCSEQFRSERPRRFCDKECCWAWMKARQRREQKKHLLPNEQGPSISEAVTGQIRVVGGESDQHADSVASLASQGAVDPAQGTTFIVPTPDPDVEAQKWTEEQDQDQVQNVSA